MFGYVITNNNTGSDAGFWSPFPRLVVKLSEYVKTRQHWDWWGWRDELRHRRETYP